MKGKKLLLLILVGLCIVTTSALSSLNSQLQESPSNNKKQLANEPENEQGPIADYVAPEPNDPAEREKRKARGKKYDKAIVPIDPAGNGLVATISSHWDRDLPPLPTEQSNLIIIGTVNDAQAYLSPNKAGIYSEFVVCIEKVFKNDTPTPLAPSDQIATERQGGRLRIPGGGTQRYRVARQGFPSKGGRYVFFLALNGQENSYFHILTAYKLRPTGVLSLDNVQRFKAYEGYSEESFLNEIQNRIAVSR